MPRPKLHIDAAKVHKYSVDGARVDEIAKYFGCTEGTIRRRFKAQLRQGWAKRKIILRQAQNKVAAEGNATMLVWLGKNELGQSGKQSSETVGRDGGPIQVKHVDYEAIEAELQRLGVAGRISADGSA